MKKIIILFAAVMCAYTSSAQEEEDKRVDTNEERDRLVMEFTWNNWMDETDTLEAMGVDTRWYSRGFNFYFMYDIPLGNSPFSVAPGIGLGTSNYFTTGEVAYDTSGNTTFEAFHDTLDYDKYKLMLGHLEIPLELRFRTKRNTFKMAVGGKIGYLFHSHTKYKGEGNFFGRYYKENIEKTHNIPNLSKLRYGLTARIGYKNFNIVGFYGLSTIFEEGKGPELSPYYIGISFNGL